MRSYNLLHNLSFSQKGPALLIIFYSFYCDLGSAAPWIIKYSRINNAKCSSTQFGFQLLSTSKIFHSFSFDLPFVNNINILLKFDFDMKYYNNLEYKTNDLYEYIKRRINDVVNELTILWYQGFGSNPFEAFEALYLT